MKKYILLIIFLLVLGGALFSISKTQEIQVTKWEYRVEYFSRDDFGLFTRSLTTKKLTDLGKEGWEYAGPLCNDGVNAQFIPFKRPIR
ncbi:MAG: hypothetical protein N2Z64_05135 [Dictyoglomus thermophilum]|nr:hypothetical protein [Dictyoglomus thermophilum]MCX7720650.1 hypothetical protein [Dictyoglomus thermophilum]